jgi:hypothetical protein
MRLDEVLALPKSGVVVLTKNDSVLVSYTVSMGADLEDMYNLFKGQTGISMRVFSAGADIETLKLHTEYYRKFYHSRLCYRPLMEYQRKVIQYKVRTIPSHDFKKVDVELVTARGDGKIVGKFKNIKEAKEFIETCYGPDNSFRFPVYALNSATKEFLLDNQKKMLDIR